MINYIHPNRAMTFERAAAMARHPSGRMWRKNDSIGYWDTITGERVNRMIGRLPVPTR